MNTFDNLMTKEAIATLEWDNGYMFNGKVYIATVNVQQQVTSYLTANSFGVPWRNYVRGPKCWNMDLSGTGALTVMDRESYNLQALAAQGLPEWQCPFCGQPNPIAWRRCGGIMSHGGGCAAPRPFALGI